MRVYLIGYMGSGKSRYGRDAAKIMGFDFIDLDELIEKRAGISISDIYNTRGEGRFREIEREVLLTTLPEGNAIISTGGGTPCSEANLGFMADNGELVYIRLHPASLAHRLEKLAETRPILQPHIDGLEGFVRKHLAEREKWYMKAGHIVKGEGLTGRRLANEIRERLL